MRLALYQPDIAPNFGAAIRLTACLGVGLDFIEPCGFPLSDKGLKRSSLDYGGLIQPVRHVSFSEFIAVVRANSARLIAVETGDYTPLSKFIFQPDDILMVGRETKGTPVDVLAQCDDRVVIPMIQGARSLNVINAAAIALGEGLRQTQWTMKPA